MTKTQHYGLSQWDPEDRVLREDFNRDNAALDTALHSLTALSGSGVGRAQIISDFRTTGALSTGKSEVYDAGEIDWGQWEYYAYLFHFPENGVNATMKLRLSSFGFAEQSEFQPLNAPGFLLLFLPWHDASRNAAGFILGDRLIPFSLPFPFSKVGSWTLTTDLNNTGSNIPFTDPNIVVFGAK